MKTFDFFPYVLPIRNQAGSFQYIEDFSETQDPGYYDALYEAYGCTFNCKDIILRVAPAPGVIQGIFDFPACPFTQNQPGSLRIFLYKDHKILGKAAYSAGSSMTDENIEGKWFLHNDFLYLEIVWFNKLQKPYKLWGWTRCPAYQKINQTLLKGD
jgi:hypothetical protein